MGEKISIITISYNSKKTIEKTFQSVLAQSYRPIEYVLIDGASKDGTVELIEEYSSNFYDVGIDVIFISEPDKGISDAFNKGIARATGDIIGIINSDDALAENALENIINTFEKDTDVVCGDCLWVDEINDLKYVRKSKMQLNKLKYEMVLMHPTCFVRKKAYLKYGNFDTTFKCTMDKELMARFYKMGAQFRYIPKKIAIMYAGGISDVNAERVFKEGVEVAVRNGVPKWKAELRLRYKIIRLKLIGKLKKNKFLWEMIKK